jgi:hypothetical protein
MVWYSGNFISYFQNKDLIFKFLPSFLTCKLFNYTIKWVLLSNLRQWFLFASIFGQVLSFIKGSDIIAAMFVNGLGLNEQSV